MRGAGTLQPGKYETLQPEKYETLKPEKYETLQPEKYKTLQPEKYESGLEAPEPSFWGRGRARNAHLYYDPTLIAVHVENFYKLAEGVWRHFQPARLRARLRSGAVEGRQGLRVGLQGVGVAFPPMAFSGCAFTGWAFTDWAFSGWACCGSIPYSRVRTWEWNRFHSRVRFQIWTARPGKRIARL